MTNRTLFIVFFFVLFIANLSMTLYYKHLENKLSSTYNSNYTLKICDLKYDQCYYNESNSCYCGTLTYESYLKYISNIRTPILDDNLCVQSKDDFCIMYMKNFAINFAEIAQKYSTFNVLAPLGFIVVNFLLLFILAICMKPVQVRDQPQIELMIPRPINLRPSETPYECFKCNQVYNKNAKKLDCECDIELCEKCFNEIDNSMCPLCRKYIIM